MKAEVTAAAQPAEAPLVTTRFLLLVLSSGTYFSGWAMLYPVLPRFVRDELGGNGVAVGLAIGAYGITSALVRPTCGRIGDRRGRRILVIGGMVGVAATLASYHLVTSLAAAFVVRLAFGVFEAAAFVGLATAAQDLSPDHRRGEAATYLSGSTFIGVAVGPALGNWVWEQWGYGAVWSVSTLLVLVGLAFGLATPAVAPPQGPPAATVWIHRTALLPGLVLVGGIIGYVGFVSFITLHVTERNLAEPGAVFVTYAVMIMLLRLFGAKLPDRYGPLPVAAGGLCLLAVGLFTVALARNTAVLFVGIAVFACGVAPIFPGLLSWVVARVPAAERTHAVATFSAFFDLAMALGGPLVGLVVASRGEAWGIFSGGCAALFALPLLARLARQTRRSASRGELYQ
ncbi:MAG: MFS transporter [Acidimicrobiales bacterium]